MGSVALSLVEMGISMCWEKWVLACAVYCDAGELVKETIKNNCNLETPTSRGHLSLIAE